MNSRSNNQIHKFLTAIASALMILALCFGMSSPPAAHAREAAASDIALSPPGEVNGSLQASITLSASLTWATRASMPTARSFLGVAATGDGKIFAIGGIGDGSVYATVEKYDLASNTWTTCASMPTARYGLGTVAASNGKIYAIGGKDWVTVFSTVEEYDPAANTWTTRASMPTPRFDFGVAAAGNGKIYVIGGYNSGGALATVEEYDPDTNTWSTRLSMPTPRSRLGVAAAGNGRIYAIGGENTGGLLATVEEYDPDTNTWTTRLSMPFVRYVFGVAAADNGKIYAIGGRNSAGILTSMKEYDPSSNLWWTRTGMPTERFGLGVVSASNGKIYAIGGKDDDLYFATVEEATLPTVPPAVPVLLSPGGTVTDTHPPYKWNASTGADSYRLAVWSMSSLSYIILKEVFSSSCTGGVCTFHPATVLPAGSYRFKVLARNAAGSSPFSDWMVFNITNLLPPAVPALISPSGFITDAHPPYRWNISSGAASYRLAVYSEGSSSYVIQTNVSTSYCSGGVCTYHPSTTLTFGDYRFKVLAWNAAGLSPYSAWMHFTISGSLPPAAPTLISPSGTITDTHPPYIWNASTGASSYRLAVYSAGSASFVILVDVSSSYCTGGVCTYHPSTVLATGAYRFKVLARNTIGSSPYSAYMNFTVAP